MSKEAAVQMLANTATATVPSEQPVSSATAPVVEAPKPAPEPKQEMESARWAHLAKKENQIVKERLELRKEAERLAEEKKKLEPVHQKLQEFEGLKSKDPIAAMKLAGFSETDLINFLAAAEDKSTPEEKAAKAAQAEIKKFQDAQEAAKKAEDEKKVTKTLSTFRNNINGFLDTNKDKYEYCSFNGALAEDLIYETVSEVLAREGELISIQEAADMVENYYEEMDKSMSSLKKRQPKPSAPVQTKEEPLKPEVSPRPRPTLSSKTSATIASTTSASKKETASEKRQRLIDKLAGLGK